MSRSVLVVSSSPPRRTAPIKEPSSGSLPSPGQLLQRPAGFRLKSGSKAAEIPKGAITGFQKLSTVFSVEQLQAEREEAERKSPDQKPQVTKRGRPKRDSVSSHGDHVSPIKRRPKAKDDDQLEHRVPVKTRKLRPKRLSNEDSSKENGGQTRTKKWGRKKPAHHENGDATKLDANDTLDQRAVVKHWKDNGIKSLKKRNTRIVSSHSVSPRKGDENYHNAIDLTLEDGDDSGRRKNKWTPPKPVLSPAIPLPPIPFSNSSPQTLMATLGYICKSSETNPTKASSPKVPKARKRRVEVG
jgi:hypothetical protein